MNGHGRKYGEKDSYVIPIWNGIFDHYDRMENAVWTFMWLIDRIPKNSERDGVGKVLGGKPVKITDIVESMRGSTYKGIRLQLDRLEEKGYISRRRTPYGCVIEVRNSRKWNIWTNESRRKGQSDEERSPVKGAEIALVGRNKVDAAVPSSSNAAAAWPM